MVARGFRLAMGAVLSIGLACAARAAPAPGEPPKSEVNAKDLYGLAEGEYDLGHFQKALELFEQVYKAKKIPALLFNIAQCHRQLGALKEARSAYRRFLEKEPDSKFASLAQEKLEEVERKLEAQLSARAATPTAPPVVASAPPVVATAPPIAPTAPARVAPAPETATAQGPGRDGAAPARTAAASDPSAAPDPGWGRAGGLIGLAGGAGTLALALVAEGMNSNGSDATGVGAVAIVVASASAVAAGLSSSSVRGVEHSTALRVAGWVLFGLAVGDALILVATPGVQKPGGLITSVGALGMLALGTLSLEALLSATKRVRRGRRSRPLAGLARAVSVRLADGAVGATLGVVGAF